MEQKYFGIVLPVTLKVGTGSFETLYMYGLNDSNGKLLKYVPIRLPIERAIISSQKYANDANNGLVKGL